MSTADLSDLVTKVDAILTILRGGHDGQGRWTPGMSPRLDDHERRIGELEHTSAEAATRQLNWRHALSLSALGAAIGQAVTYARDHIK